MIITNIIGGLGNQMFQYAIGRKLALQNHDELELDVSGFVTYPHHKYSLQHFNIIEKHASEKDTARFHTLAKVTENPTTTYKILRKLKLDRMYLRSQGYIKDFDYVFDPTVLTSKGTVYLDGYWQSEKYFKDIEDILRKEFTLKTPWGEVGKKLAEDIQSKDMPVCLHVRRGDFMNNPEQAKFHGVSPLEYYYDAVKKLTKTIKNPHFFVFSDSIDWVKENLKLEYPVTYTGQGADKNYEDLMLMTYCKHHILSNSTFGWWGAWLSINKKDQIVIAPKKWFSKNLDLKDLMPSHWIQM